MYGFEGPKMSTSAGNSYRFTDANDLFKAFFSQYGFDNSENSFFNSFFENRRAGGAQRTTYKFTTDTSSSTPSYYSTHSGNPNKRYADSAYTRYSKFYGDGRDRTSYTTKSDYEKYADILRGGSSTSANNNQHSETYQKYADLLRGYQTGQTTGTT